MMLSVEKKIEPIVGVISVLSEFVNKMLPKIAVAVGNLNKRTGYPFRADFNTLKEAIAVKIDSKILDPLQRYKKQMEENKDAYPKNVYREVIAIIELEEKKWKKIRAEILALNLDKVNDYKNKLVLWQPREVMFIFSEVKAGLEVEMNKIKQAT